MVHVDACTCTCSYKHVPPLYGMYMHMHMYMCAFHGWCAVTWDSTGVLTCVATLISDVILVHSSAPSNDPNTLFIYTSAAQLNSHG